jgi:hypothetical protein
MNPVDPGRLSRRLLSLLSLLLVASLGCSGSSPTAPHPACQTIATPAIFISEVPPVGSTDDVKGSVAFVSTPCTADSLRVALYIHVPGFSPNFVCKPLAAQPLTSIADDGSWAAQYATGGIDTQATEFHAFLVKPSFSWPCFTDSLPPMNGSLVLAAATAFR